MERLYYIGLDIHKKTISYCVKKVDGTIVQQGKIAADRKTLLKWMKGLPGPWFGAMEATLFTGWVYDFLKPYAVDLKVAHPEMLKAITAAKKKNDRADAEKIADLLRVNLLPECHMLSEELRELRRILRYRNMIVRTAVKMKNKISGLLMEVGATYNKEKLHRRKYFNNLLERVEDVPASVKDMLKLSRSSLEMFEAVQKKLVHTLREDKLIYERVQRLMSIKGVGEVMALTWVLEIGDSSRFHSARQAISYAGKDQRGPISRKRNKHLQTILIETAKLAPRWNPQLAALHEKEVNQGHRNRATISVARKLVEYMLAVERQQKDFVPSELAA